MVKLEPRSNCHYQSIHTSSPEGWVVQVPPVTPDRDTLVTNPVIQTHNLSIDRH